MSVTTIQIPDAQIRAVRESLRARREDLADQPDARPDRLAEIDSLLQQIGPGSAAYHELTGPSAVLWAVVYDSLCAAAERFAADCNELWRGATEPAETRTQLAALGVWLDLLETLGSKPVEVTDA